MTLISDLLTKIAKPHTKPCAEWAFSVQKLSLHSATLTESALYHTQRLLSVLWHHSQRPGYIYDFCHYVATRRDMLCQYSRCGARSATLAEAAFRHVTTTAYNANKSNNDSKVWNSLKIGKNNVHMLDDIDWSRLHAILLTIRMHSTQTKHDSQLVLQGTTEDCVPH